VVGGVFSEDGGGVVNESSQVTTSPRTEKLLKAEKATLEEGGIVIRLAGE